MSSPKREAQGKSFSRPAITQSKIGNILDHSSDYSFDPVSPPVQQVSHEYCTPLPAFKNEASSFHTFSIGARSPLQSDLSVVKLPQLVSKVGVELALREPVWNEGPHFVASALSADIPVKIFKHSSIQTFNVDYEKPSATQDKTKTRRKCKLKPKPLTGTEVVEILTKKRHLGEHEFYSLKASENGPYRPYDLHVVPQSAVGRDYYNFSPTTVIHVQEGCSVELWSLAGWYQESLLWEAVRHIPFFRYFLLRKTFKRWHRNVHIASVKHRTDSLPSQLLLAVPQFRDALLQLSRLIEEIKKVSWLPQNNSRTYALLDFQTALLEKNKAAQVSLSSFLHCHAALLDMAKNKSYQVHKELQMEVEHSKLYQTSKSLNLQLTNLRNLQKELCHAEQALQRLGNLSALVDCMIVQNLVTISKQEANSFLNNALKRDQEQQGAFFHTEIVFGADGQLTVFPPLHLFQEVLHETLLSVPNSVLQVFDSCSLSRGSEVRLPRDSMFISNAQDLTAGTGRACTSRNTDTAAGAGSVFSQKKPKMSPQTIVPVKMNSLRVQGQRVQGHYQALPRRQLEWHLKVHTCTQEIQNEQARITQEAITEVNQLCKGHSWFTDVHLFTNQWRSTSLAALRGCSSIKYEELIKKLHFWMDRVQSMPSSFTTSNKLFTVKIYNVLEEMGSMLSTIDKDVQKLLCEDLQFRSENLTSELTEAVEVMKSEPNTFDSFTAFSKVVKHSVNISDDLKKRLEDLNLLQETLQRNYTPMAPDGGFLMKPVTDLWNQFVPLLKRAADIVFHQLPSMVNTLDSNFSTLANKLENLVSRASSEPYLDPDQNAKEMLIQLNALCSQFYVIAGKLNNQSRASETIRGHLLDLSFVTEAQQKIEARRKLWELMSVSSTQIQEWKLGKFRKFVVGKAQDKIIEWLNQAEACARVLPSHDAVLQNTLQILQGFSKLIPVLSKLSSLMLNQKYWRNLSKEISLLYDPEWKLTLGELMSKELQENQNRINKIYVEAKAEADMEQTFKTLQRHWKRAVFRHTRFIIAVPQLQSPREGNAKEKNTSHSSRLSALKHHIKDGETFTILGLKSTLAQVKESVLNVSDILRSLHIADLQQEVKYWLSLLQELDKLLDIFEKFQRRWIFLSKTFNETSAITEQYELQEKFHPVDKMFRDIIVITVKDPHILSFVQLKLTTEASHDFQGQSLYTVLINGLTTMEEISSQLLSVLESARSQFPRLYFLSDEEVMQLLSLQLPEPSSFLPLVQKCFRGVRQLDVHDERDVSHDLTDLSNDRVLVRGIYGTFREHVPFLCHLESNLNPVAWLSLFEEKLHQAMKWMILKCKDVQQCSNLEECEDTSVLIGNYRKKNVEIAHEPPSLLQLISLYPLQCLMVAEEVLWCTMTQKLFHCPNAAKLAPVKSRNTSKLHYLCQKLKAHLANSNEDSLASQRIINGLRSLVMLTMKHSQQTNMLFEVKVDLDSSFEWHKLTKYYLSPSYNVTQGDLIPAQEDSACVNQSVYVDILCTQLPYGYEYISPENWMMVTTHSTEKACMGTILALSSYKCAFISGPHMSGKKHVAEQLGYALGQQVVSMKCCSSTGSSIVSQMLLGALQSGAWLVFDSVDLMEQGTLSELGQHLTDIHQHLSIFQKSKLRQSESIQKQSNMVNEVECLIAGKNILAKLSYGCITIAAKAYSTEIPENLRVAVRPVSLVHPHYKMIAEVIMVSLGFSEAANLSRRLVFLFSLAKDSHCLPDFVNDHNTSWLVLLKKVLAASGTQLHHDCRLRETNKFKSVSQAFAIINEELEEQASIKGVLSVMQHTVSDPKRALQFHKIFEEIFPKAKCFTGLQQLIDEKELNILKNAVKDDLEQRGFPADALILQNVLILYQALMFSNVVFLVGPAGSGKTTLYQALANALQKLSKAVKVESDCLEGTDIHHHSCWTSVSTEVLFPNALSHKEFYGGYCDKNNSWFDGAFTKALRHTEHSLAIPLSRSKQKNVQMHSVKWIVLDGDPQGKPAWLDALGTLCNLENPYLCLSSGEKFQPTRGKVKILSEITDLGDSSPSVVTEGNLVYVSGDNLWKAVLKSKMDVLANKHNVDQITLKMWGHLAKDLFSDTLMFLRNKELFSEMTSIGRQGRPPSRITDGLQEVMSFFRILHAFLEHFGKEGGLNCTSSQSETTEDNTILKPHSFDAMAPSAQWGVQARNLFLVAYIWGFGGHLHPRHWPQFDLFAREVLYKSHCKVETPPKGTVFEHFFDFGEEMGDTTNFINWNKRKSPKLLPSVSQYERLAYLLDMLLDAHQPTLLVGESGSGKTMLCKSLISRARPHLYLPAGPGLRPSDLHKVLERMRYQNSQQSNMKDAAKQQKFLMYIDDLHEAPFDVSAVLRQSISRGEMLTTEGTHFKQFQSKAIDYLSTCSVPHLGTPNHISPRLFRLFTLLALPSMTLEILFSVHSPKLQPWLKEIQPMQRVADMANCIITSTVDVYFAVHDHFSTDSNCRSTTYCLHDIHKVFQGIYLWGPRLDAPKNLQSGQGVSTLLPCIGNELNITRLWMHECLRTFGDRIHSNEACQELISLIAKVSEKNFGNRLCHQFQTLPAGISNLTDESPATSTCYRKQQVLSNSFHVEDSERDTRDVRIEPIEESHVLESDLRTSGDEEGPFSYSKDKLKDENVKSEQTTLERKYESVDEPSTSCPPQQELFTQHVPSTTCEKITPRMIIQRLQDIASSIHNIVFGPDFCGPLNNILHHFKCNAVYQERDADVLVNQLLCAIKMREEQFANSYYIPRMTVNRQNVFQLLHILRALFIPGGHGALFGATRKTGRKTIVRLASSLLGWKLIELHPGNENKLKEILKEIGSQIAVGGKELAVLVHDETSQPVKNELLLVMANGNLPGLYTDQELKNLILRTKTWMKNTHIQLNDDEALEMYFKTIQTNMHVFLLYPLLLDNKETQSEKSSALQKHISKALSLCCCVEVYRPWTSEALVESALYHFKNNHHLPELINAVAKENSLLATISQVMAEIHQSSMKYAVTHLKFQPFSPQSYIELMIRYLYLFGHLFEQNKVQEKRLANVLASVKGMTDTVERHTQEVLSLRARCEEKKKSLEELQDSFDSAHKIWEDTSHQSLLEEKQLSQLEKQSRQLQQQVHDAFKQVSPLFQAAVEALQSLSHSDLDEVRRYRTPPEGVVAVMDIICMLFNRPLGWANSRQLLMQSSFFEELEFFDCSTLSAEMMKTLGQIVQAPRFQPSFVRDSSRACEFLCCWLGAVYQYACVQRRMAPQIIRKRDLDELMAESRARLRVSRLQEMSEHDRLQELKKQLELNRQDMMLLKLEFSTAEEHERESSATLKLIESHIEDWNSAEKEVNLDRQNVPGDALILAATITYLGPFRPDVRQELLQKWHTLCLTGVETKDPHTVINDVNLTTSTCVPIPVNREYQIALNRVLGLGLIPRDYSDLVRTVILWGHRVGQVQRCPLLADVHQHELMNSQTLFPTGGKEECHREDKYGLVVSADDPQLLDKLNHAAEGDLCVLVKYIERAMANIKILQPFVQTAASVFLSQSHSVKAAHPGFRLFMSTPLPVSALINENHHSFLDEVQIINLSLSPSEVQDLILTELMKSEYSEEWTLHCQVKTEKLTLQHKLSQNEVSLMEYVMCSSTPLLQDPEFLPRVHTCQSVSLKLEAKIKELSQEIDRHKSLMAEFHRAAVLTTALYNALQDVAQLSHCYLFTLRSFLLTLRSALKEGRPDVSIRGPTSVIAEITNRIVSHLISQYKCSLFRSNATLLRLLVSVALIVHSEGCSESEQDIFLRGLNRDIFLSPSTQSVPELPSWIPAHVQADVYLLETIAPFGGLVSSLISTSKQWQEYLCFPSSTVIGPIPCQSHTHLSTIQRAILWKTLCPNWLAAVEEDLAAFTQGHLLPVVATGPPMGCSEELFQLLCKNVGPVVVELPNKNEDAHMSIHPLYLIQEVARHQSHKKAVEVNVISFGSVCHRDAVLSALDIAVQNGHWLVLNNCHLLDCWDVRVVYKLTQLVSCEEHVTDVETNGPFLKSVSAGKPVHPNFRLWLITKGDNPHSVPAAVRISALHLVCDSSWDLKDDLWSSVRQALSALDTFSSPARTESAVRSLQQCAVLHSVLLQRQASRHLGQGQLYFWTQEDLLAMIDAHDRISKRCSETAEALEYIAGHLVYGGHVSDLADLVAVQSVVTVCLRQSSASWGRGPHNLVDIISCTGNFDTGSLLISLSHRIQRITDSNDPIALGFSPDVAGELMKLKSQTLNILLHQSQIINRDIRQDTRILMQSQELPQYKQAWERLLTLRDKLRQKVTDIGVDMGSAYLSHLRQFFQAEWECLDELVSFMLWDNFQPAKYNVTSSTPINFTSEALSRLETRADLLESYLWEESSSIKPHAYQLSAFLNPQGFLVALIRDVASIQKKDISVFSLHFKVLKDTSSPSSPSPNGVFLCGLQLQGALWDPASGALRDTFSPKPSYFPALWVCVEESTDDESFNSSTLPLYSCPLYVDRQTADGYQSLSAHNIVTHVPLPTRFDSVLCTMRRVRLTSTLIKLQE